MGKGLVLKLYVKMSYTHPFFKFSLIFRKAKVLSKREAPMNTFERYILKIDTKLEKKKKVIHGNVVIILILPGQREEYKQRHHRFLKESQLNKYVNVRMFVHKYSAS